nr:hypothetical protein [Tanacetum cinerariifolium]
MNKRKRFKLTLGVFRNIFKICPKVQGQYFDALPTDEEIMSFIRELGHIREINSLNDVIVNQMHQPWRTFIALFNRSYSGKTIEPTKSKKRCTTLHSPKLSFSASLLKTRQSYTSQDCKEIQEISPSKKDLNLSLVPMDEEPKSAKKKDFHRTHPSGSGAVKIKPFVISEGTGDKPGVLNVTKEESSKSKAKS